MTPLITADNLTRIYDSGSEQITAVDDVSITVERQKLTVVTGASGSGKSTLINLLSGLDDPTSGEVLFDGTSLQNLSTPQRRQLRLSRIGFVFQSVGALPYLTAAENVSVPLRVSRMNPTERDDRVHDALSAVGLAHRADHRPDELSGGERQRVAIARAIVTRPDLILADEPTGQLDSITGKRIIQLMHDLINTFQLTVLVVTHDAIVMQSADNLFEMSYGKLQSATSRH